MKKLNNKKTAFAKSDYKIAMQLYYLNKKEMRKEARLPKNDFRNNLLKKALDKNSKTRFIDLRKTISRIAAIW